MTYSELYRYSGRCDELLIMQNGNSISDSVLRGTNDIKVVQTEQLCSTPVENRVINEIRSLEERCGKPISVIDYSHVNKEILLRNGIRCTVKDCMSLSDDVSHLVHTLTTSDKKHDIAFVGCLNPRRKHVIDRLRERGYTILIS